MPSINEKWQCKGVNYPQFGGARGVAFMDNTLYDWIILAINVGCLLFILFWLILNQLPQSNMLRPLGIKVFNLCIQTNSLLSLIDFDLGISLGNLMYSRRCMIILGLV